MKLSCLFHVSFMSLAELDPCKYHKFLQATKRLVNVRPAQGGPYLSDRDLKHGWYRFTGLSGAQMPTVCVPEFSCGTKHPVWMKGTHPRLNQGITSARACVSATDHCCLMSMSLRVKQCKINNESFFVYSLKAPLSDRMAYCVQGR